MRRILQLLFLSIFLTNVLSAQTVFFTENFTTAGAGWTFNVPTGVEGADPNFFKSSAEEGGGIPPNLGTPGSCGVPNNGNNCLFVTSVFNPTGGAAYDAGGLCGILFCPQADSRTESPIINCTGRTSISVNFNYIEGGQGATDDATIWYNVGTGFVLLDNMPKTATGCGGQGLWVSRTIALPASADNNPNVQIAFGWINDDDGVGTDPSFAVDDVTLTVPALAIPVVTITPSPNDTICQSATLTMNGSATNGPITDWAWTVSPSAGVVFAPDTFSQNPTVTFALSGTYTFTLFATNGDPSTGSITQVIEVLPMVIPTATITAPVGALCAVTNNCFTVTATDGGTTPTFQWDINGGANPSVINTLCSSTLNNNDVISCTVTSNAQCLAASTVVTSFTVTITPTVVPSVAIASDDTSICAGTLINFTTTPTNGGVTPAFQWQINGLIVGANSPNFSSSTLNNNDTVIVILTSNAACAVPSTATSDSLIFVVTPTVVPTVAITQDVANPFCAGTTVNFTATPINGGGTPVFQWDINGIPAGSNSPNFSSSTLANNDVVSITFTSNAVCATPTTSTSSYTLLVNAPVVPSVTITPDPASACAGASITFSATTTNDGTAPVFQWVVNGSNIGINDSIITLSGVVGGELVSVILTSNATCITAPTANSNTVTVTITPNPTLSIVSGTATVCPNEADTIIVTASAGATFTWSPVAGLNTTSNDTVVATNLASGIYTYYVTATLSGCSTTDSVNVTVSNGINAVAGPPQTICNGQTANLSVVGGTSWDWTPITGSITCDTCQNTTATPTTTTTYTVVAALGACTDTVTQTITVIPNASASFNATVLSAGIPQTISFTNTSINALTFFWTFGDNSSSVLQTPSPHDYNAEGSYTVTLIAYGVNGCNDTNSTVLMVIDSVGIVVPNIFTPNGDEINDVWKPGVHGSKTLECTIYNRWGILVYQFVNTQDHWDGFTTGGLSCQEGTYYYILKATDRNNKSYDLKGYLQLIH